MKTRISLLLLAALCCQIPAPALADKPQEPAAVTVQVEAAKRIQVPDTMSALGTMEAVEASDLSFSVAGHITTLFFKSGDRVKKDDVIAVLDDTDVQSKLASLKANLEAAESKYKRYQLLKDSGVFSKQDIIEVNTAYKVAEANYASALAAARNLKLLAPFDGTLGEFKFSAGAYVGVGEPVVNLVKLDPLKVKYSFDQSAKQSVSLGQGVEVSTDALPKQVFRGKVTFISPTQDTATGRFNLEAEVANPEHQLSPGFFVDVTQLINHGHSSIVVPQTAIVADQDQAFVYVVNNNVAKKVAVKLGKNTNNGLVEVTQGLNIDDQVVINGTQKLDNGIHVTIIKPEPSHPAKIPATKPVTKTVEAKPTAPAKPESTEKSSPKPAKESNSSPPSSPEQHTEAQKPADEQGNKPQQHNSSAPTAQTNTAQ